MSESREDELVVRGSVYSRFFGPLIFLILGIGFLVRTNDLVFQISGAVFLLVGIAQVVSGIFFSDFVVLNGESLVGRSVTFKRTRKTVAEFQLSDVDRLETRNRATEELPKLLVLILDSGEEVAFPEGAHRRSEQVRQFLVGVLDRQIPHREI